MAFMMRKKRYRFDVELCLDELTEVSYSKAILLAKVRQLDGGSFTDVTDKVEVRNHCVKYRKKFVFPTKMTANASSGILEACRCRVSIRMEEKGGRHFRKLGFVDINLAEYAGAGPSTQRYILQPYDSSHRLDNSIVQFSLNIIVKEGDPIFKRPFTRTQPILLPGEESRKSSNAVVVSCSAQQPGSDVVTSSSSTTTPQSSGSPLTTASGTLPTSTAAVAGVKDLETKNDPASHTRNSSSTSQVSQASCYGSQTSQPLADKGHSRQSSSGGESSHGRNLSGGSTDTGFYGSMEKHRRDRAIGVGRVDADTVIQELLEGVDLVKDGQEDGANSSGLQLFVAKDGTVTFDKNSSRAKDFEPVVIDGPR